MAKQQTADEILAAFVAWAATKASIWLLHAGTVTATLAGIIRHYGASL